MNIANDSGASVRADINDALAALVSLSAGATAPSTTFAYMLWHDTTTGFLKQRNSANTAWLELFNLADLDGARYAADAEASDTYAITLSPVPSAYFVGMEINFTANTANTGAATLNVNTLGAKTIKKKYDQDLETGDIESGQIVNIIYDGTNFQMQSQVASTPPSSVMRSYLAGLELFHDTDTDHDIGINVGMATDSTQAYLITLAAILTKRIDATWAVGDDAGGMNDGETVGNATWYHVHLLYNPTTEVVDAGFDTSITAANLLADTAVIAAGYTKYRRIGSVLTDGSANILNFIQVGDIFRFLVPILDVNVADQSTTYVARTISTPLGIKVQAFGAIATTGTRFIHVKPVDASDGTPSTAATPLSTTAEATASSQVSNRWWTLTNTSAQIHTGSERASTVILLTTEGWVDRRGRDD